jgi:SOS-response transcriptional repressor LexA
MRMTTLAKRIKTRRTQINLSQQQLADNAGVSQSLIHKLESGDALGSRMLPKIAKALGVTAEWLATGENFEIVSTTKKGKLINVSAGPEIRGYVPLISWIQAGKFNEAIDLYHIGDAENFYPLPKACGPRTFCLRVVGDSMTNTIPGQRSYPEGTIIYVDPDKELSNGCRVIVKLPDSNEATFKEYREDSGKRYLKPLNQQYEMAVMPESAVICGVVCGSYFDE